MPLELDVFLNMCLLAV